MIYFRVDFQGKRNAFPLVDEVVIGRGDKADHIVDDPGLSKAHCKIYVKDNQLFIKDLQSKNGVFLNDIRVSSKQIYLHDRIRIADTEIQIDELKLSKAVRILFGENLNRPKDVTLHINRKLTTFPTAATKKLSSKNKKLYEGLGATPRVRPEFREAEQNTNLLKLGSFVVALGLLVAYKLFS